MISIGVIVYYTNKDDEVVEETFVENDQSEHVNLANKQSVKTKSKNRYSVYTIKNYSSGKPSPVKSDGNSTTLQEDTPKKFVEPESFNMETSFDDDKYFQSFLHAFAANDEQSLQKYGENILKIPDSYGKIWWYGNTVHVTNILLGKMALKKGKVKEAGTYLLASVKDKWINNSKGQILSPQLSSFGPDTSLAYDLYLAKSYDVVIEYFKQTKKFWISGVENGTIDEAILNVESVKKGEEQLGGENGESEFPFSRREVLD